MEAHSEIPSDQPKIIGYDEETGNPIFEPFFDEEYEGVQDEPLDEDVELTKELLTSQNKGENRELLKG